MVLHRTNSGLVAEKDFIYIRSPIRVSCHFVKRLARSSFSLSVDSVDSRGARLQWKCHGGKCEFLIVATISDFVTRLRTSFC